MFKKKRAILISQQNPLKSHWYPQVWKLTEQIVLSPLSSDWDRSRGFWDMLAVVNQQSQQLGAASSEGNED